MLVKEKLRCWKCATGLVFKRYAIVEADFGSRETGAMRIPSFFSRAAAPGSAPLVVAPQQIEMTLVPVPPPPPPQACTALRVPFGRVKPRFKAPREVGDDVKRYLPLVPAVLVDPAERLLAATRAAEAAREALWAGRQGEGDAGGAYLSRLAEELGAQASMGESDAYDVGA